MQNKWTCFGPRVRETHPVDCLVFMMQTDTTVSPGHKLGLFAGILFNAPLWAHVVSLGNVPCRHRSDPGFKISSTHRQTQPSGNS